MLCWSQSFVIHNIRYYDYKENSQRYVVPYIVSFVILVNVFVLILLIFAKPRYYANLDSMPLYLGPNGWHSKEVWLYYNNNNFCLHICNRLSNFTSVKNYSLPVLILLQHFSLTSFYKVSEKNSSIKWSRFLIVSSHDLFLLPRFSLCRVLSYFPFVPANSRNHGNVFLGIVHVAAVTLC